MPRLVPLTTDRITGLIAPLGVITGFAQSRVRSAWPTPIGKPLTDRKIALYASKGRYASNVKTRREKQVREKKQVQSPRIQDFV
jgi:hypothetical protein